MPHNAGLMPMFWTCICRWDSASCFLSPLDGGIKSTDKYKIPIFWVLAQNLSASLRTLSGKFIIFRYR